RLSLPSKGRLAEGSMQFLEECGLKVVKTNPRQYEAFIPSLPEITVLFQRPGDIVVSVRDGSVDFGITGIDLIEERKGSNGDVILLHDALGFGHCTLCLAVPETWETVQDMDGLGSFAAQLGRPLRVATRYPRLTSTFLDERSLQYELISAEGTLETAPAIGYADMIADLVSSGQTLRDNRLRQLPGGEILASQAALIANQKALKEDPKALAVAKNLLEYFEAHLRAVENVAIFANIRGENAEDIAGKIFAQRTIGGLQGPTISRVIVRDGAADWFAVHIVVRKDQLFQSISELRAIGGSGVVVSPVLYIFEEEPPRNKAMLEALQERSHAK
ncbi:MAG: ATP phosphoribosyltransferase, partial [Anaerolineales bacterium]